MIIRGPEMERNHSRRLRAQAESQIRLLTEAAGVYEGDFYSYRYFAAEGFLPGYNFPRLPLSAYVPGRHQRKGRDEFISRPRFLAISNSVLAPLSIKGGTPGQQGQSRLRLRRHGGDARADDCHDEALSEVR